MTNVQSTPTKTRTRRSIGIASAALSAGIFGAVMGVTPANAADAPGFSGEELQQLCSGETISKDGGVFRSANCTYKPNGDVQKFMRWKSVPDTKVSACDGQSNQTKRLQMQTVTFSQSWTVGGNAGLTIKDIFSIGVESSYTETSTTATANTDEIVANSGQTNFATLGEPFVRETGPIEVTVERENRIGLTTGQVVSVWEDAGTQSLNDVQRDVPDPTRMGESGRGEAYCGETNRVPEDPNQWWDNFG